MKAKLMYKDKAGNKLYRTYVKTRKVVQYSAKNKEGKLLSHKGVTTMMKRGKKTLMKKGYKLTKRK